MLRAFSETHIDQDCRTLSGRHENGLFFNCVFEKLNGLTLQNCDLNRSQFTTTEIRDALGFTLTLDCLSFNNVQLSELLFDLILVLLTKTSGNTAKRRQLMEVVSRPRMQQLLLYMEHLES